MAVLGFLVPLAILGLIVWGIVGATRRGGEAFTLATATAIYARVMLIAGIVTSLVGVGIILKALIGFLNLAYSYYPAYGGYAPSPTAQWVPLSSIDVQQRSQDLVLGITLLVIGALVAGVHRYLGRAVARMPGGSPGWVERGTLLGLTVMTAVVGIPSTAVGLYQVLSYFIVGASSQNPQPWGETAGLAIAFVPAWVYLMSRLVHDLRRPHVSVTTA